MMKRLGIVVIAALVLGLSSLSVAQSRPNFTGKWSMNQDKSSPGSWGNQPDVNFFGQLTVKQGANEMHVVMENVRQAGMTAMYKYDGSRVNIEAPEGITETATASWEGNNFVVTSRRSYVVTGFGELVSDTKETWTLTGNELKIEKTRTSEGLSETEFAVYDKI